MLDLFPSASGPLALVGNAPGLDAAAAIDAAPCVVRFNNAPGFGGRAGARVTHLALVNRGGQMREWLADPRFLERPVIRFAQAFILPFPMLPAEQNRPEPVCWTREAMDLLAPLGKPVHILPEDLHRAARLRLAAVMADTVMSDAGTDEPDPIGRPNPSTGFLVTLAFLLGRPLGRGPVEAHGFGFDGWPGHPWAAERAWFRQAEAAGQLRLHPCRP
ncbi:hypothetical protein [Methylobacterium sp. Leaf89]|uniref:hypothetical protein n=1 Tax=Methylobacterium sp. Leaf89 TaxID=1736245 RepID=UPI0012E83ABF|nr:hypothetical protein [Methylobacterium sp. Leaf89]